MDMNQTAERIEQEAEKLGYETHTNRAGTGTWYVDCTRAIIGLIRVRISNHAEAYAPKVGLRQISVSPDELTVDQAIERLADPASVEPSEGPAPLTSTQRDYLRGQNDQRQQFARTWQTLRETLTAEDFAEFKSHGANRPAARAIAERLGTPVAATYAALTSGKKW